MGNTNSCLISEPSSNSSGKTIISSKLETSLKTGVLNLADQDLKPTSAIWAQLSQPSIVEKLTVLDLSGNALKVLPSEIYKLLNLKTLIINRCNIQRLNDISCLERLIIVRLQHNQLESDTLHSLPHSLQHLTLSHNNLVQLPSTLYTLDNVMTLDLSHNKIESVYGIERLVNLKEIILDNNELSELPESISKLTKLHTISLAHNKLQKVSISTGQQSIPRALFLMISLQALVLTGNPLTKAEVLEMDGMEEFLVKRKILKDKTIQGGAMVDLSLFGLD